MPVVRIPRPLFERLQAHAEPLVDTPARVIERLIEHYEKGFDLDLGAMHHGETDAESWRPERSKRTGALKGDYIEKVLLVVLLDLGGSGRASDVLTAIRRDLGEQDLLQGPDLEINTRDRRWERWETNARYGRKHLVETGLLLDTRQAGHGTWRLSERGWKEAERLKRLRPQMERQEPRT